MLLPLHVNGKVIHPKQKNKNTNASISLSEFTLYTILILCNDKINSGRFKTFVIEYFWITSMKYVLKASIIHTAVIIYFYLKDYLIVIDVQPMHPITVTNHLVLPFTCSTTNESNHCSKSSSNMIYL